MMIDLERLKDAIYLESICEPEFEEHERVILQAARTYLESQSQPADGFDYQRVKKWALSKPRKAANTAFTASTNRDVAYLIEDLENEKKKTYDGVEGDDILSALNWVDYEREETVKLGHADGVTHTDLICLSDRIQFLDTIRHALKSTAKLRVQVNLARKALEDIAENSVHVRSINTAQKALANLGE